RGLSMRPCGAAVLRVPFAPALLAFLVLAAGCGGAPQNVPLLAQAWAPFTFTPARGVPLEVVTRSTAVRDPLPVAGSDISESDVETTLGLAISSAAAPWADARKAQRPGGWQLSVELIQAEAEERDGRLIVTLSVRATLFAREGKKYLAQTQASCR